MFEIAADHVAARLVDECVVDPVVGLERKFGTPARDIGAVARRQLLGVRGKFGPRGRRTGDAGFGEGIFVIVQDRNAALKW